VVFREKKERVRAKGDMPECTAGSPLVLTSTTQQILLIHDICMQKASFIQITIYCKKKKKRPENRITIEKRIWFATILIC